MLFSRIGLGSQIIRAPTLLARPTTRLFTTLRPVSPMAALRATARQPQLESPTQSPILSALSQAPASTSIFSNIFCGQRRWKSRGNTFQPNTYKRKRTSGFITRMKTTRGRKIIAKRKAKGRWYLSY